MTNHPDHHPNPISPLLLRQRAAFDADPYPAVELRIDRINRALALLVDNQNVITEALAEDFGGRPASVTRLSDIWPSVKSLKFARRHVKRWMRREKRRLEFPLWLLGAKAWVDYKPKGVVGLISPWNFPVALTFKPLAGMLAAGNRVMIKMSEYCTATSTLVAELIASRFDETEITVVTGDAEVGAAFSQLAFDHLLFTGSTMVGREIMRAAADNLTPVTLELGGKSPVVIGAGANLQNAAERILLGKMINAGQVCLAPDYILIQRERLDDFISHLCASAKEMYPSLPSNNDYTAIITNRHRQRLENYIADARAKGAEVIVVGDGSRDAQNQKLPLYIMQNVSGDMKVMQEEIFGPILPIIAYNNIADAVAFIKARPRPLALYFFGEHAHERRMLLEQVTAGGVTLNDVVWHFAQEDLPFGGVGASGMGAYHGFDGFKAFSHATSIYRQSWLPLARLIGAKPPYGRRLEKFLKREITK